MLMSNVIKILTLLCLIFLMIVGEISLYQFSELLFLSFNCFMLVYLVCSAEQELSRLEEDLK